jgi:UDP-N-acetylmuramate dehydrogenase
MIEAALIILTVAGTGCHVLPAEALAPWGRMQEIQKACAATQPIRENAGGSTFASPENQKSWKLIEKAGCRGLRIEAEQLSRMDGSFLVNTGNAAATEIEALGEEARSRVREIFSIDLRGEIKRTGVAP